MSGTFRAALVAALLAVPVVAVSVPAGVAHAQPPRHQLDVGAGVLGYFAGGAPGTSGAWDVRYAYTPRPIVSLEAGYLGAAGDAVSGISVTTIFEGDARLNLLRGTRLTGYGLLGVGWGSFRTPADSDSSNVVVPIGLGADYQLSERWTAGGRATMRFVGGDEIDVDRADADNWSLVGRIGASF